MKTVKPRSKAAQERLRKQFMHDLARDIAAVLVNPMCPAHLYNAMTEQTTDWLSCVDQDSESVVFQSLNAYMDDLGNHAMQERYQDPGPYYNSEILEVIQ